MPVARWLLTLWLLLTAAGGWAQPVQEIPALKGRVTDLTGTLDSAQQAALEQRLAQLEGETGSQLAVLLVRSTAPEDIAAYAIRVVDAWQLGRKDVDDGVLFLVATEDRRMRIEVGYGLEGALPDARARRIIDTIVGPHFRRGDYAAGIDAGTAARASVIRGEALPAPRGDTRQPGADIGALLPVILVIALGLGGMLRHTLGAVPGSLVTGAITGFVAWLIVGVMGVALLVAAIAFFISLLNGGGPGAWSSMGGYGGGFGGRRGGLGGGFGGGFGGGGGGFGGGGASGSW